MAGEYILALFCEESDLSIQCGGRQLRGGGGGGGGYVESRGLCGEQGLGGYVESRGLCGEQGLGGYVENRGVMVRAGGYGGKHMGIMGPKGGIE